MAEVGAQGRQFTEDRRIDHQFIGGLHPLIEAIELRFMTPAAQECLHELLAIDVLGEQSFGIEHLICLGMSRWQFGGPGVEIAAHAAQFFFQAGQHGPALGESAGQFVDEVTCLGGFQDRVQRQDALYIRLGRRHPKIVGRLEIVLLDLLQRRIVERIVCQLDAAPFVHLAVEQVGWQLADDVVHQHQRVEAGVLQRAKRNGGQAGAAEIQMLKVRQRIDLHNGLELIGRQVQALEWGDRCQS
ncbi:hypothetical protein D3C73_685140 [compost metagenome]